MNCLCCVALCVLMGVRSGTCADERDAYDDDVGNGHRLAPRLDFARPRDRSLDQIFTHVNARADTQDGSWPSLPG